MNLSPLPIQKFFDNNGRPLNGGLLFTYVAGTNTKLATYSDEGGTLNTNPVVLDFRGEANVWLDQTLTYKFVLAPEGDTDPPTRPIWSVDNISAAVTYASLTQQIIGQILYPRTTAENTAGVTPTRYWYPEGNLFRYWSGTGDISTALQNAINVMAQYGGGIVSIPPGSYTFDTSISLSVGVSLIGSGELASILTYSGSGIAISLADTYGVSPFSNYTTIQGFKLTTTTSSPSLGPGTHGIRLTNSTYVVLREVEIRGFATAGLHFLSTTGKSVIYIDVIECHIHENAIGVLNAGINGACNVITLTDSSIRANTQWNIYTDVDFLGWSISGCALEAGGTSGTGGSVYMSGALGLSLTGCYFEQTGGASGLSAIDLSSLRASDGVTISGNYIHGGGTGTGIKLGTSAFVRGVAILGNDIDSWTTGINPAGAQSCIIAANKFTSVTTEVAAPGGNSTGVIVADSTSVKTYGAPVSQFGWDGSAWNGFPAYRYTTVPIGSVAYATFGTDTPTVNGTIYYAEIHIREPMTITGAGIISGSVGGGADKYITALYSATGTRLANSALAGTTFGSTNVLQQAAFTAPYTAAPGKYWVSIQANGATGRIRTVAANTFIDLRTTSATGTFGTLPALTPPTTFTADVGPIAYVY